MKVKQAINGRELKLTTSWDYTEEVPPVFKRLMMLLLKERVSDGDREKQKPS